MGSLLIHMGTPKTGTSAIQTLLEDNFEELRMKGILYPQLGESSIPYNKNVNGRFIVWGNCRGIFDREGEKWGPKHEKALDTILGELEQYRMVVLSEELLWNGYQKDFFNKLRDNKVNFSILVYVRPQEEYLYSMWNQMVKMSDYSKGFEYFCVTNEDYKEFNTFPDYYERLSVIKKESAAEEIHVCIYNKTRFINDFVMNLGLDLDGLTVPSYNVNPSLSPAYVEVKRRINTLYPKLSTNLKIRFALQELSLSNHQNITEAISPNNKRIIREKFFYGNKRLEEEFGCIFCNDENNPNDTVTTNLEIEKALVDVIEKLCVNLE